MIEAHNLSKLYGRGVYALRDLSLRVDKGEFVFLTGPSGAGKSTLLRLLLRRDVPTDGQLVVGGRDLATLTASEVQAYRRSLGFVFQDFKLLPRKTVLENVALVPRVLGVPISQQQRRGSADQQGSEPEPAALAARHLPDRPTGPDAGQAEPVEHELGAPVGVPGVVPGAPVQDLAVAAQQVGVVGVLGDPAGELVELAQGGAGLAHGVGHDLAEGGVPGVGQLLLAEAQVRRPGDGAGVRGLDAGEQPQQRRLAGAVLADQADAPAGCGGEGDAVEDGAVAVDLDQIDSEKGCGHADHRGVRSVRPPGQGRGGGRRARSALHDASRLP